MLNNFILDKNLEKDRNRAFNTDNYFGMNKCISFKQSVYGIKNMKDMVILIQVFKLLLLAIY